MAYFHSFHNAKSNDQLLVIILLLISIYTVDHSPRFETFSSLDFAHPNSSAFKSVSLIS